MKGLVEIEQSIRQFPPGDVNAVHRWLEMIGEGFESPLGRVTFRVDQARRDAFSTKRDEPPAADSGLQRLVAAQPAWAR